MTSPVVVIDLRTIVDKASFHDVFARAFGFPDFYGRNMSAWVDCLTSLDAPNHGMTNIHTPRGGVVVLQLDHAAEFKQRCPDLWNDIVECSAFVNWRRVDKGESAVLALAFSV